MGGKKMWHLYPNETPPDIPEDEDFGVEYEVRYKLPNGKNKNNDNRMALGKTMELYLSCYTMEKL